MNARDRIARRDMTGNTTETIATPRLYFGRQPASTEAVTGRQRARFHAGLQHLQFIAAEIGPKVTPWALWLTNCSTTWGGSFRRSLEWRRNSLQLLQCLV